MPRFHAVLADWNGSPRAWPLLLQLLHLGQPLWPLLEDLYVDRDHRRKGVAKALMAQLARMAIAQDADAFSGWCTAKRKRYAILQVSRRGRVSRNGRLC